MSPPSTRSAHLNSPRTGVIEQLSTAMFTDGQRLGADERGASLVPVLVSLLTTLGGMCSAAAGFVLDNTAMMFAGMVVGGIGSVLIQLIGKATSRRRQAARYEKGA